MKIRVYRLCPGVWRVRTDPVFFSEDTRYDPLMMFETAPSGAAALDRARELLARRPVGR
jgi:hypothetical protein